MLKNSIDKIVKDKLDGVGVEPPAYVWNSINQHMLEDKQRKRILFYWQSAAAVALIVLSVGIIYFISEHSVRKRQMAKVEKREVVRGVEVDRVISDESVNKSVAHTTVATSAIGANIDIGRGEKKAEEVNESSAKSRLETAEVTAKKNTVSAIQPEAISGSKMEEAIPIASMDYMQAFAIEVEVPDAKLHLPGYRLAKSPVLYDNNIVMSTYKPKTKRYKFVVGGSASPTYNYRSVSESQNSSVVRSAYDSPTNETGVVSVSGGVNIRMEGKSRWSFETGVLYSQVGQEVSQATNYTFISGIPTFAKASITDLKSISISSVNKFNNSLGAVNYNNNTSMGVEQNLFNSGVYLESTANTIYNQSESATLKQLLDYIEVPMMVRYTLFNNKPVVTLAGGFSTNFLVDNNVYVIDNGEHINAGETDGINSVTYSSSVGIGLELPLGKSIRFSLEPRFKYYLSPVNSDGYNSFRPYSFGVFGGISFILNNH